jgi:alpha-1,6-mannosyltransferase
VFIAVAAARAAPSQADAIRVIARAAAIVLAVLAVVTLIAGVGFDWISTGVFSTPQKVHIAITPSTNLGYTVWWVLHKLDIASNKASIQSALGGVSAAITLAIVAVLLWRVRRENLVRYLGIVLVVAAIGGPALWPWYLIWGLALLAACPEPQRSLAFVAAVSLPVFVVKPNGIVLLSRGSDPKVLLVYVLVVIAVWVRWRRRRAAAPAIALT